MITIGGLLVPVWVAGSCIAAWLATGSQTCPMSIHILESRAKRIYEKIICLWMIYLLRIVAFHSYLKSLEGIM